MHIQFYLTICTVISFCCYKYQNIRSLINLFILTFATIISVYILLFFSKRIPTFFHHVFCKKSKLGGAYFDKWYSNLRNYIRQSYHLLIEDFMYSCSFLLLRNFKKIYLRNFLVILET